MRKTGNTLTLPPPMMGEGGEKAASPCPYAVKTPEFLYPPPPPPRENKLGGLKNPFFLGEHQLLDFGQDFHFPLLFHHQWYKFHSQHLRHA